MNLRQIQDIAGHRDVPPWVVKLVQDCIEHDRTWEREKQQVVSSKMEHTTQEPVAWGRIFDGDIIDCICPEEHALNEGDYTVPLYAAPVSAKREWVDLTCQEITALIMEGAAGGGWQGFAERVLAAFKEKNK